MNLLDIIIIAALVFFIVRGIFRGFFREVGSLAGVILGIWIGYSYHPQMAERLSAYLPSGQLLPLISFTLLFTIVLLISNLAGWSLKKVSKKIFFGWADRSLGAILATMKGVILTYLVIVLLTFYVPSKAPLVAKSRLAPLIITSYQSIVGIISPGSHQKFKKKFLRKKEEVSNDLSKKIEDLSG